MGQHELNAGAAALAASGFSLTKLEGVFAEAGCPVARSTLSRWRKGEKLPGDSSREVLARPPTNIPVDAWDRASPTAAKTKTPAAGRNGRANASRAADGPSEPPAPRSPRGGSAAAEGTRASDLAEDLLARIRRWREQSEIDGTARGQQQLAELEMKAIKQFADLTGQVATSEAVLVKSAAWKRVVSRLTGVLERHPAALREVIAMLEATVGHEH
jgi:hypothetical protein